MPFHNDDVIVRIDDVPIKNYAQINAELARRASRKIAVTVERAPRDAAGSPAGKAQQLAIAVSPQPMRTLGLVMKMGPVTAIQSGSPAAAAGILPGDLILEADGRPVADPMTLPEQLNEAAGSVVKLTVGRQATKLVVPIEARQPIQFTPPRTTVASQGLAYRVLDQVDRVIEGGPAAKAGLLPGDVIVGAKLIPPAKEILRKLEYDQPEVVVPFTNTNGNWPWLISELQWKLPGTNVELTFTRQGNEQTAVLQPVDIITGSRLAFLIRPKSCT